MRLEGFVELLKNKTDLEKKVMNLGMDNNLIKNQAELFKEWFVFMFSIKYYTKYIMLYYNCLY